MLAYDRLAPLGGFTMRTTIRFGILAALVTDEIIGRWAFTIALAPTMVALVDWVFDQSR